jgi:hypothetical protein
MLKWSWCNIVYAHRFSITDVSEFLFIDVSEFWFDMSEF